MSRGRKERTPAQLAVLAQAREKAKIVIAERAKLNALAKKDEAPQERKVHPCYRFLMVCDVREISKPWLSQRRYVVLEGDTTRCFVYLQLQSASMTSLVTTRSKGRAWCLVRSRVIVASRFWELPFLGEREKLSAGVFFRHYENL